MFLSIYSQDSQPTSVGAKVFFRVIIVVVPFAGTRWYDAEDYRYFLMISFILSSQI